MTCPSSHQVAILQESRPAIDTLSSTSCLLTFPQSRQGHSLLCRIVNCKLHVTKPAQAKLWKSEVCLLSCATHISSPLLQRNFPVLCLPSLEFNSQLLVLRKKIHIKQSFPDLHLFPPLECGFLHLNKRFFKQWFSECSVRASRVLGNGLERCRWEWGQMARGSGSTPPNQSSSCFYLFYILGFHVRFDLKKKKECVSFQNTLTINEPAYFSYTL